MVGLRMGDRLGNRMLLAFPDQLRLVACDFFCMKTREFVAQWYRVRCPPSTKICTRFSVDDEVKKKIYVVKSAYLCHASLSRSDRGNLCASDPDLSDALTFHDLTSD
ncbi:hypothetical protein M8J77_003879 [Diaphorina citri]|nr:hypothetical protein M8J77_003879 [Diaphorina citri]